MNIVKSLRPSPAGLKSCAAFAAALVLGATLGGQASAQQPPQSVRIYFKDVNLRSPDGASKVLRRIRVAADQVCGDRFIPDLTARHLQALCRVDAVQRAVRDLDVPTVTALAHRDAAPIALAGG